MSVLGDEFRAKSKDQSAASDEVFAAADFDSNPKKQAIAIIGKINATVFGVAAKLADQAEFPASPAGTMLAKRLAILRQNDELRRAAANGDWNSFDSIVAAIGSAAGVQPADDGGTAGATVLAGGAGATGGG